MSPLALTLALQLVTGGVRTDGDVVLRSEARAWSSQTSPELSLEVGVRGEVERDLFTLRGAYVPRFLLRTDAPVDVLHGVDAEGRFRLSPLTTLSLREDLSFGREDFSLLGRAAEGGPQPETPDVPAAAPELRSVAYVRQRAQLRLETTLSRRLQGTAVLGHRYEGALDAQVRGAGFPLVQGPHGELALRFQASRRDTVEARASLEALDFTPGMTAATAEHLWAWRRQLTRTVTSEAAAGVAAFRTGPVQGPYDPEWMPAGQLGLELRLDGARPFAGRAYAGAVPFVDPFTAQAYPRTEAGLSGLWRPAPDWQVGAAWRAGVPMVSDPAPPDAVSWVEATGGWAATKDLWLTGGVRWVWQRRVTGTADDRPRSDVGVFFGLALPGVGGN